MNAWRVHHSISMMMSRLNQFESGRSMMNLSSCRRVWKSCRRKWKFSRIERISVVGDSKRNRIVRSTIEFTRENCAQKFLGAFRKGLGVGRRMNQCRGTGLRACVVLVKMVSKMVCIVC